MIEKVNVDFENCYGIKSLKHEFDFTNNNMPVVIYSPNGTMKTSFAMTFSDHAEDRPSKDRIHKDRVPKREIVDENGNAIPIKSVFVINSHDKGYKSDNISKLLVSKDLKDEYDNIYKTINDKKETLINALKKVSGIKKEAELETDLTKAFNLLPKQIFTAFGRVEREVKKFNNPDFAEIPYKKIFSEKVSAFLEKEDFKQKIADYSKIYEDLIENSSYYKRGIFNHNNAATIAKNLKSNGWFDSGHSVNLNTIDSSIEIKDQKELEEIIQAEKDAILKDPELTKSFDKIDKALSNAELKAFREYILENQFIIPELTNLPALKEKLWIGYLNENQQFYDDLMQEYDQGEARIAEIVASAKSEATKWREVIKIFNERFSVPFIVNMDNQDDVILGRESPQISFDFKGSEQDEKVKIDESKLRDVLSNGERRALYILNIIFEVNARQETQQETVFVVDDIADSFDYKNKYAIIEYLRDIRETEFFHLIILTHNFDFYRTVKGRIGVWNPNKLHSVRTSDGISFVQDPYDENPFLTWRDSLSDIKFLIASIPFIRNLSEYMGFDDEYSRLTELLHMKPNTASVTHDELSTIYKAILHDSVEFSVNNPTELILDSIYTLCDEICVLEDEEIELERKIILSIGVRLRTENYLITEINDRDYTDSISRSQTSKLIKRYKKDFPGNVSEIEFIDRVNLMTPENIHLNSFMYEPILDMSNEHLKNLYINAKGFNTNN